ncbi:hypothetical protein CDG77_23750 [Nostoc sp. 'Peltigera membranacea cyanobiont' 213]|uniref:hypothetical protein n=1 Tax=Nostoc sp. 'Peltigera membranacea cyanobiont' 213 TaxID=2014530 RepID=UPI000B952595|nr:hypothetical protein [Nostoc sp. 'Peltigera membranacea cyanobiont' 213]OYD88457.1 hypothetical protein CDG77_23750 [Nostoc sp. 'Peltigera membranacea cyanobiont' 213]
MVSKEQEKIFFPANDRPKTGVGWEITTTSGEAEIALAQHLANTGAKEYGCDSFRKTENRV